jgi:hypothetical protein
MSTSNPVEDWFLRIGCPISEYYYSGRSSFEVIPSELRQGHNGSAPEFWDPAAKDRLAVSNAAQTNKAAKNRLGRKTLPARDPSN